MALRPTHFPGTHAHACLIYTPRVPGLTTRVGTPTPTHRPCASVVRLSHQGPGVAAAGTKEAPPGFSPTSSARVWLALADLGASLVPQTDSRFWRTQVMGMATQARNSQDQTAREAQLQPCGATYGPD